MAPNGRTHMKHDSLSIAVCWNGRGPDCSSSRCLRPPDPAQADDDPPLDARARRLLLRRRQADRRSTATPTWSARCTSNSASRRSRRIPIRSSWCTAAPAPGTTYTGTPDGREGWAQYFVRRGYAVYVVDQPGRGRSGYLTEVYGPCAVADARERRSAAISRRRSTSCGRRRICTRNGRAAASPTIRSRCR